MRFNFEAYKKVFPDEAEKAVEVDSAVDTFKPTESEAKDNKPGDDVLKADPTPAPEPKETVIVTTEDLGASAPEGAKNE